MMTHRTTFRPFGGPTTTTVTTDEESRHRVYSTWPLPRPLVPLVIYPNGLVTYGPARWVPGMLVRGTVRPVFIDGWASSV